MVACLHHQIKRNKGHTRKHTPTFTVTHTLTHVYSSSMDTRSVKTKIDSGFIHQWIKILLNENLFGCSSTNFKFLFITDKPLNFCLKKNIPLNLKLKANKTSNDLQLIMMTFYKLHTEAQKKDLNTILKYYTIQSY